MNIFLIGQTISERCGHGDSINKCVVQSIDPYGGPLPPAFLSEEDAQEYIDSMKYNYRYKVVCVELKE